MEAGHKDIGVLLYAHLNFKRQTQASPVSELNATTLTVETKYRPWVVSV